MKRRKFLLTSGSAVLTGATVSSTNQSALGVEFKLSTTPDKNPSLVDSLLIDFTQFNLTPQYLDSSDDITVSLSASLDGIESDQLQTEVSVKQNISRSDISSDLPLIIDGINISNDSITGEVVISVDHSDLDRQTYRQNFQITNPNIIDDFEDGDIAEYGSGSGISVTKNNLYNGSYSLECDPSGMESGDRIKSFSGLNRYPRRGDTFYYRTYHNSGNPNFTALRFGEQSNGDRYQLYTAPNASEFKLLVINDGSATTLANISPSIPSNEWLRNEISWGLDGTINCRLYDSNGSRLGEISPSDSKFDSGGIGLRNPGFDGARVWYDDIRVVNIIDSFEDQDMTVYSGDTGSVRIQDNNVINGSYNLNQDSQTNIYSQSGLNRYPQAGDTFRYHVYLPSDSSDTIFVFGRQDSDNLYNIHLRRSDTYDDIFSIVKRENGSRSVLAGGEGIVNVATPEYYEVQVEWKTTGKIIAKLFDEQGSELKQISGTDSAFTGGGIGWQTIGSETIDWDYLRLI